MFKGFLAAGGMTSLVVLVGTSLGCDRRSPSSVQPTSPTQRPVVVPSSPPLLVTAISPAVGSTGGDTFLTITGTGFVRGAIVTLGGSPAFIGIVAGTTMYGNSSSHAAGKVDVIVTNPDGQTTTLAGGYSYALPESFDFNGNWEGGAGSEQTIPLRFTIRNNLLIDISCGASGPVAVSTPPVVANGQFSFSGENGTALSGRILAPSFARGTVNIPPCTATSWSAAKQ